MEKGEKKQGRRTYTQEFKLEAVRLVRSGIPKARVSRVVGLHLNVQKVCLKQSDQDPDNPFPGKGKMRPEEAELFRLKRELMKVTAERDILKKALAYFAKELSEVRLHGTSPQCLACTMDGRGAGSVREWVLRVARAAGGASLGFSP